MQAYILKYALTKGILYTEDAELAEWDGFITVNGKLYNRSEYATDPYEARVRADALRQSNIEKHKRAIDKLKTIDFYHIKSYNKAKL